MATKKMTKRQYEQTRTALVAALDARNAEVEAACDALTGLVSDEEAARINAMHDAVRDAEQAITDLDWAWNTRGWVQGGEWETRRLVMENAD